MSTITRGRKAFLAGVIGIALAFGGAAAANAAPLDDTPGTSIAAEAPGSTSWAFNPITAPDWATVGVPYGVVQDGAQFSTNAANDPSIRYSAEGNLPPGLSVDPVTGLLAGTPTMTGTYFYSIVATRAGGSIATPLLGIAVSA